MSEADNPSIPFHKHKNKNNGAEQASDTRPSHKVLIVEDTTELAEVLRVTLEQMNLQVWCETHGSRALEVYHNEHPDLVLLDIALPDTTGWKVLDTIKKQRRGEKKPLIVVITAYGDPANRLMGKLQGVHSYLIKPLNPQEVRKTVAEALGLDKT